MKANQAVYAIALLCRVLGVSASGYAQARMAIFAFIHGWYNPQRRHSSIGFLSPTNFESRIHAQITQ